MGFVGAAAIVGGATYMASENASDASDRASSRAAMSAEEANRLARDEFEWSQERYRAEQPLRMTQQRNALAIQNAQMHQMNLNTEIARDTNAYNKGTFRPLEKQLVAEAQGYDTAARRTAAMAGARADVEQAYGSSQAGMNRAIMRTGGTVGGSRSRALMMDAALDKAKAISGATTGASRNVEQQGWARRMDAASLGRGLPSQQATASNIAINAGSAAGQSGMNALQASSWGSQQMQNAYGDAARTALGAGALHTDIARMYGQQSAAGNQALGNLAGSMMQMYAGGYLA